MSKDRNSVALILAAQGGCVASRNRLVVENMGLIVSSIHKALGPGRHEEWHGVGVEAFINAIAGFKAELGLRLSTYAATIVYRAVRRARTEGGLIRVPEYHGKTSGAARERMRPVRFVKSVDTTVDRHGRNLLSSLSVKRDECDGENDRKRARLEQLHEAMGSLGPREQTVLLLRSRGLTLKQVGAEVGLSSERVRQVQLKAMKELRERMEAA